MSPHAFPTSPSLTRRLTVLYLLALGMIALLTIVGQIFVQNAIVRLEGDSRIVNVAGRQRMLSQRLTRMALELVIDATQTEPNSPGMVNQSFLVEAMKREFSTWTKAHEGLRFGSQELQLPGNNTSNVLRLFEDLEPDFEALKLELEKILQQHDADSKKTLVDSDTRKELGSNSDAFLAGMDAVVTRFEQEARDRVHRLRWIESVLMLATISVLVCEGLFVFSPAVASLKNSLTRLQHLTIELQIAKQIAEKANVAKTDFLTRVSHELRTPLHAILGMLGLVERGKLSKSQRTRVHFANEASGSLRCLVDDLLDVSSIEQHRELDLHPSTVDLHALLSGAVEMMRPHATGKRLELHLLIAANVPQWIEIDSDRLRQIVMNLLQNAVRYTERGYVRCAASLLQNAPSISLKIDVEDTGVGISKVDQERIFGCFVRGTPSETVRTFGRGLGLGLSITQALVKRMSGSISLESKVGRGTCFTFILPIKQVFEPIQYSPSCSESSTTPQVCRSALIVDDAPTNRRLMQAYLKLLGYRTRSVQTLSEAIGQFERRHFDLVFMDRNLPDGDGAMLPEMVRHVERHKTRIFLVTAEIGMTAQADVSLSPFAGVLHKPLSLEQLRRAIDTSPGCIDPNWLNGSEPYGDLQSKLAKLIMEGMQKDLLDAKSCIEEEDFNGIEFLAHRLFGGAGNAGLIGMAESAKELALAAQQRDILKVQVSLTRLSDLCVSPHEK